MTQQNNPTHVQWQPSDAVWHTYNSTSRPQTCISQWFSKDIRGQLSAVHKSLQHSVLQPKSLDPRWVSHQTTSAHAQCNTAAPWPFSFCALTQTRSASWVGGAATQCYATYTRQRKHSQRGLRSAWSNTGTMRLSHPPTGTKTTAPIIWDSPWPFMGYSDRPGIGLVRIRKINSPYHTNINKSIPSSSVYTLTPLAGKVELATS